MERGGDLVFEGGGFECQGLGGFLGDRGAEVYWGCSGAASGELPGGLFVWVGVEVAVGLDEEVFG